MDTLHFRLKIVGVTPPAITSYSLLANSPFSHLCLRVRSITDKANMVYLHFDIESIRHVKRPHTGSLQLLLATLEVYASISLQHSQPLQPAHRHTPTNLRSPEPEKSHQTFTHFCAFQFSTRRVNRHFYSAFTFVHFILL